MSLRRRDFAASLAAAVLSPALARAKDQAIAAVGYIDSLDPQTGGSTLTLLRRALGEARLVEGRNISIVPRWANGQVDRLPALASDLVRRRVAVIVASSDPAVAVAAKAATATIPIVFTSGADPVRLGLVASLDRPGGNATGVTFFDGELALHRLKLLRQVLPPKSAIGFLVSDAGHTTAKWEIGQIQAAARSIDQPVVILSAGSAKEIDDTFAGMAQRHIGGLIVGGDRSLFGRSEQLIALAARYRIVALYFTRAFAEAGGLMSYGDDRMESWVLAADYVARILMGEMPARLPVVQPIKFELVVNLKTAKAAGFAMPRSLLTEADAVIE